MQSTSALNLATSYPRDYHEIARYARMIRTVHNISIEIRRLKIGG